jgi:hypothetical protein
LVTTTGTTCTPQKPVTKNTPTAIKPNTKKENTMLEITESRNANYELLKKLEAFEPETDFDRINGTCANIKSQVEGKPDLANFFEHYKTTLSAVPAPLVLSRLCAGFKGLRIQVGGQENYKTTWDTILRHKKTGHVVTFYDYKGGISYGSNVYGARADEEFIQDLKDLIEALKDPRFPHPYDGCVVGEEA